MPLFAPPARQDGGQVAGRDEGPAPTGAVDASDGLLADPGHLIRYNAMCQAIAAACKVDEVKVIRDKALALQTYARQGRNIEATCPQLTEPQARTIHDGMFQTVRLRLAALAPSAGDP
jgi:hypothetical protein